MACLPIGESRGIGVFWFILGGVGIIAGIRGSRQFLIGGAVCMVIGLVCWIRAVQRENIVAKQATKIYEEGRTAGVAEGKAIANLKCPDCGHENQEAWTFCSSCGGKRGEA